MGFLAHVLASWACVIEARPVVVGIDDVLAIAYAPLANRMQINGKSCANQLQIACNPAASRMQIIGKSLANHLQIDCISYGNGMKIPYDSFASPM